jgi:hypothetical protein
VSETKKYYLGSRRKGISYVQYMKRKTNSIAHIWRRNCLLKFVTEGKIEERKPVTERRGRRWKQLLDHFKETSG